MLKRIFFTLVCIDVPPQPSGLLLCAFLFSFFPCFFSLVVGFIGGFFGWFWLGVFLVLFLCFFFFTWLFLLIWSISEHFSAYWSTLWWIQTNKDLSVSRWFSSVDGSTCTAVQYTIIYRHYWHWQTVHHLRDSGSYFCCKQNSTWLLESKGLISTQ